MEVDPKVKEGPQKQRKSMSDAQKEKIRQTLRRNREKNKAAAEERKQAREAADDAGAGEFLQGHIPGKPTIAELEEVMREEGVKAEIRPNGEAFAVDVKTGLDREERETIDLALKLDQAEARIREAAIPKDARKMILKEVRVDSNNLRRYYVELTPSMCDVRGCGFDAAIEAGATDWNNAPVNQPMPNGKTIGQRLIELKDYHKATAHTNQSLNDHIVTAEELNKRQWGIGQDIRGDFLTGAR